MKEDEGVRKAIQAETEGTAEPWPKGSYERYLTKLLSLGLSPCLVVNDEQGRIVADDGRRYTREELRRLLAEDEAEER